MRRTATLLRPPLILSQSKSRAALPEPLGLPGICRSRAQLGCLTLPAAGRRRSSQVPCRTSLRSSDHPAQGGERSPPWYLVVLLEIGLSNSMRGESKGW